MPTLLRISETASLAMHAMALLASAPRPLSTARAAVHLKSSSHTLAKVFRQLAKAGMVKSKRGPQGGFVLRRPAAEITLRQIYEAVEGEIGEPECLLGLPRCLAARCALRGVLQEVHAKTSAYLNSLTAKDLAGLLGWIPGGAGVKGVEHAKAQNHPHRRR